MANIDTSPEALNFLVETRVSAKIECSMCKKTVVDYGDNPEEAKRRVVNRVTAKGWQWAVVNENRDDYFYYKVVCHDCRCSLGVKL